MTLVHELDETGDHFRFTASNSKPKDAAEGDTEKPKKSKSQESVVAKGGKSGAASVKGGKDGGSMMGGKDASGVGKAGKDGPGSIKSGTATPSEKSHAAGARGKTE